MFTLTGTYNTAKLFATQVEETAITQIIQILNQPFVQDARIRIMPDVHAGTGCVIGFTMTIQDAIVPNLVGVDIGCGVLAVRLQEKADDLDLQMIDEAIYRYVPAGRTVQETEQETKTAFRAQQLLCAAAADINENLALRSIGTLGGGNHFVEVDKDSAGNAWLLIHTGSRHLGLEVCKHYQKLAQMRQKQIKTDPAYQKLRDKRIADYKRQHREAEIQEALEELSASYQKAHPSVPAELACLTGADCEAYLHDIAIVQAFARDNREAIAEAILRAAGLHEAASFHTVHNYIDVENRILRKGSVSAQRGEDLLIPINMRDGALLCKGKGNPDYNCSAPHGAGRLMSRSKAKASISLEAFQESMKGIYSTSVNTSTIDESPMAYRGIDEIVENIRPTAEIIDRLVPIYNFKASE